MQTTQSNRTMKRSKYLTKFSNITLKTGMEPDEWVKARLALDLHPMRLYAELKRMAEHYNLPMVSKRTLYTWIDKVRQSTTN